MRCAIPTGSTARVFRMRDIARRELADDAAHVAGQEGLLDAVARCVTNSAKRRRACLRSRTPRVMRVRPALANLLEQRSAVQSGMRMSVTRRRSAPTAIRCSASRPDAAVTTRSAPQDLGQHLADLRLVVDHQDRAVRVLAGSTRLRATAAPRRRRRATRR